MGFCLDENNMDQNNGVRTLPGVSSEEECLQKCRAQAGAKGCEYYSNINAHRTCAYHTEAISSGSGDADYVCWNLGVAGIMFYHYIAPFCIIAGKIYLHQLFFSNITLCK